MKILTSAKRWLSWRNLELVLP